MSENTFKVQQIDHIEMFVPDQYEAAAWYEKVLGLTILRDYEHWAADGPLMVSSDGGGTMLALFKGEPQGDRPSIGLIRLAFRVDADGFIVFLGRLADLSLVYRGQAVTADDFVDHDKSWSVYFSDPYGNALEVTTYDYDAVRSRVVDIF